MVDFKKIEKKWQNKWEKAKIFKTKEKGKKYYVLEMFPYPSGSGLHMGHAFNYTIGDIHARFKRMQGYNVLYPMGYDALGLPAENAAIKAKTHPRKYTETAIKNFIEQQKSLGLSYDWSRIIRTCDPEYYKWNQFFFLEFLKNDLVYRKKAAVNWCSKCKTVLANEQVHDGKCWRHKDTDVEVKQLEQWFIKTTEYAEQLLEGLQKLKWPERIKIMQKNWIGKSQGTEINFKINNKDWPIFTTRPDTLYGVTFMVISAQHPRINELITDKQKENVNKFLKKVRSTSEKNLELLEKEGAFTGSYAIHPLTKEKIPVYTGNFVLAEYGSGMVMAVPAHDQRDFEFAKKYKIPIKIVIQPKDYEIKENTLKEAYTADGILFNSNHFNKLENRKAIGEITNFLEKKKLGKRKIQYKLRDWLISRQRYWGTPIPIIYCEKCGIVPEKNLPVKLPEDVKFGEGNPLKTSKKFVNTTCPKCKSKARRETDTMDTFFDSSWYFLRYCDSKNTKQPFNKTKVDYWMPVDQYIGGAEHACMHLIYARFFTKALKKLGFINQSEPFPKLFNQGMLHGPDGFVMSKSRGNVVNPLDMIKKHSADILRFYLISTASPDNDFAWSDKAVEGSSRFINKVIKYFDKVKIGKSSKKVEHKINKAIKDITEQINDFKYNLAVIQLRDLINSLEPEVSKETLESFLKILHPFCPHLTEELWQNKLKRKPFLATEKWPTFNQNKIDKKVEEQETYITKIRSDINMILKLIKTTPKTIYLYSIPNEKETLEQEKENLEKDYNLKFNIFAVNDKKIIDPQNKAKKAKPNKPAIYVE